MNISYGEAFEVIRCQKCKYFIDQPYGLLCGHFYCTTCIERDIQTYPLDKLELKKIYCDQCLQYIDVKECKELTQEIQKYMRIIENK